ncbi:MAG: cohesin domain-containing protein, partial [Acutalibacteraceae bacterium]
MKRLSAILGTLIVLATMFTFSYGSVYAAASGITTVNGVSVEKGKTVTYDLRLSDVKEKVEGIQMNIYYDTAMLKLDESSVEFDVIKDAVSNTSVGAVVRFNASNLSGYDFSKEKSLIRMSFETLKT